MPGRRAPGAAVVAHAPKREIFDVAARANTDPKGFVRPVDVFRETAHGLYMAREADHPRFSYVESWLLPALDLRITDFHFTPGNEKEQEFYVDIMTIERPAGGSGPWRTRDLYLDIICRTGAFTEVLDGDELALAIAEGFLDPDTGGRAMETAFAVSTGIAAHGHSLTEWLRSEGLSLEWLRR